MTRHLRYLFPRTINHRQLAAGQAWYDDWITGGSTMAPQRSASTVIERTAGKLQRAETVVLAGQRFREASVAIKDPALRYVAVNVVLHEKQLGEIGDRQAGSKLKKALDRVASVYLDTRESDLVESA